MTLHTHIVVKDPVPAEALFRYAQSLLGRWPEQQYSEHHLPDGAGDGQWWNELGQGLPALLWVTYGADGPLTVDAEPAWFDTVAEYDEYVAHRSGCVSVHFDTTYGYRGARGGCADLHAWLVFMVGAWLDDRGAAYEWQDEFTDRWYSSALDAVHLGDPDKGALPHFSRA